MHRDLHAVTFDCWGTLIYEPEREQGALARREIFRKCLKSHGVEVTDERAHDVLREVWMRHWREWQAGISTDSTDMAGWGLEAFGISDRAAVERLGCDLAEASLEQEVRALDGARETLEQLARREIRRALICDTGYSPGRVVRQLLQREGLLELLEVLIFSNEAGVPKPNPRIFQAALDPLRVGPEQALHVGDLRRSDIAGAHGMGMRSVRIRWQNDDTSDLPDAHAVVDSHAQLRELLHLDAS